jgi:hypothetical protein
MTPRGAVFPRLLLLFFSFSFFAFVVCCYSLFNADMTQKFGRLSEQNFEPMICIVLPSLYSAWKLILRIAVFAKLLFVVTIIDSSHWRGGTFEAGSPGSAPVWQARPGLLPKRLAWRAIDVSPSAYLKALWLQLSPVASRLLAPSVPDTNSILCKK